MTGESPSLVLVAHRRAPVQRLIRTNLDADGHEVAVCGTAVATLAVLRSDAVSVLVLDADLIRGDTPEQAVLRAWLLGHPLPLLLLSCDPGDHPLARSLNRAQFLSRPDDIEQICRVVRRLTGSGVPA